MTVCGPFVVADAGEAPAPKFHDQESGTFTDISVNVTVCPAVMLVVDASNNATGGGGMYVVDGRITLLTLMDRAVV